MSLSWKDKGLSPFKGPLERASVKWGMSNGVYQGGVAGSLHRWDVALAGSEDDILSLHSEHVNGLCLVYGTRLNRS